jgi:YidC/Oxa1 family membrane protein insertase
VKLFGKGKRDPAGTAGGRKDYGKLPAAERVITFYAEDGGSWPHLEPIVTALVEQHGEAVCYLTSSDDDPILTSERPGVRPFSVGEGMGRSFLFQTMETGVLVATVPQLGIAVLPRSRHAERLGTQYLYVFHSMASTHMIYEPDGFDHYDTVFTVGPYMEPELRKREELAGLPAKELVPHGYGRLDTIRRQVAQLTPPPDAERPTVLIAPSWGPTCIFETIGVPLVQALLDGGCRVIARPHPMTAKRSPAAIEALTAAYAAHPDVVIDRDVAATKSLAESHLMVSDWSGAALEYAFGFERPVLFVDVERKVNNPDYASYGIEPFEVGIRERIGAVVAPDDLAAVAPAVRALVAEAPAWPGRLAAIRDESIFHVGRSGEVAAAVVAEKAAAFRRKQQLR